MKIEPVSGIDEVNNRISINRINDNEKQKHMVIPSHGYKSKQLKLILKFRKFIRDYNLTDDENNKEDYNPEYKPDRESEDPDEFDSVKNVIFSQDIPEKKRIQVNELLSDLSQYQGDEIGIEKIIILNRKNINIFIELLTDLKYNNLYFSSGCEKSKDPGSIIDFKA